MKTHSIPAMIRQNRRNPLRLASFSPGGKEIHTAKVQAQTIMNAATAMNIKPQISGGPPPWAPSGTVGMRVGHDGDAHGEVD